MSRRPRIYIPGGVYHEMPRGNGGRADRAAEQYNNTGLTLMLLVSNDGGVRRGRIVAANE